MPGECKGCGVLLERPNLLECEICGQDQREEIVRDLMSLPDEPEDPECKWTREQWEAWDRGEEAQREMMRRQRKE